MKGGFDLGSRMNSFFVEMDASTFMYTMTIPKKFGKKFKGSNRENVELEGPSGITWHVKMIRSNNTFALRSGWKEFIIANRIDKNDVLVFTYNGNSSFKVAIFDRNGCEKAAPFFAKKMELETESEESNDSLIRETGAPPREVKKEIISLSSGSRDTDESFPDMSNRAAEASTGEERVHCKRKRRSFVQESSESESDSESDEGEHETVRKRKTKENRTKKASVLYIVPNQTYLTKAQKQIADRMTRKTQKGSDLFVKILTRINTPTETCSNCILVRKYISFSHFLWFACKVLQSNKKKITLMPADLDKRSKVCTANYYKNKCMRHIGRGWRKFVLRNGLKQGDLCLFELRKQDKEGILTMVVHFNNE